MNKYIARMKKAVTTFQGTARRIAKEQERNREALSTAYATAANAELSRELLIAENDALNEIQAVLEIVTEGLGKTVPLDGKAVTSDVQLLCGAFDLSKEQLQDLVEKHRNNPTMLNAIMKYVREHRIGGVVIPTQEDKLEAYKTFANGARNMMSLIKADPFKEIDGLDTWGTAATSSERLVSLVGSGDDIK